MDEKIYKVGSVHYERAIQGVQEECKIYLDRRGDTDIYRIYDTYFMGTAQSKRIV